VSPLRAENPQNRPLSELNNRRFALRLRAMLPVKQAKEVDNSINNSNNHFN